ncbi:MAG: outer membrane beta-barrel protein [Ottowia sp.]|nr:outer membrane beta-barrel protein [Ottowia sp.]
MNNKIIVSLFACAAATTALAANLTPENFAGISAGATHYTNTSSFARPNTSITANTDNVGFGFKAFGGTWLNDNFGAEIGYVDLGKKKSSLKGAVSGNQEERVNAFYAAGLAGHKFENKSRVYGKLGVYNAGLKTNTIIAGVNTINSDSRNTGLYFGAGYSLPITETISLRAEAERFYKVGNSSTGKKNVNFYSIGATYQF